MLDATTAPQGTQEVQPRYTCGMPVFRLDDRLVFPPVHLAEDGLLALGGDLRPERLLLGYTKGIFPWYAENLPILSGTRRIRGW